MNKVILIFGFIIIMRTQNILNMMFDMISYEGKRV
jgi:hypothetical protein